MYILDCDKGFIDSGTATVSVVPLVVPEITLGSHSEKICCLMKLRIVVVKRDKSSPILNSQAMQVGAVKIDMQYVVC